MHVTIELSTFEGPELLKALHALIEAAQKEAAERKSEGPATNNALPEVPTVTLHNQEAAKAAGKAIVEGLQEGINTPDEAVKEASKTVAERAFNKAALLNEIKQLGRKLVAAGVKTSGILKAHGAGSVSQIPDENLPALLQALKEEEAKIDE